MTPDVEAIVPPRSLSSADLRARNVKLSIVMPAYNEDRTILHAVETVLAQSYPCPIELIVVDDGSARPAADFLTRIDDGRLRVHRHDTNLGKGAALRQGASMATGTHFVPFDADLEYDPADLGPMLQPVLEGRTHVVYGTRLFGVNTRYQSYIHGFSNRILTLAANLMFDAYLSDLHTCLKLMPLSVFKSFPLRESGFGLDTEMTAWLLRAGLTPFEVPVSYHSRSRESGKKIDWRDGVICLRVLGRVRRSPRLKLSSHATEPLHGHLAAVQHHSGTVDAMANPMFDPLTRLAEEVGREAERSLSDASHRSTSGGSWGRQRPSQAGRAAAERMLARRESSRANVL